MADSNTQSQSIQQTLASTWSSLVESVKNADQGKIFASLALVAIVISGIVVSQMWLMNADYVPLYSDQESFETARVVDALEANGIDYDVNLDTGKIWVPKNKLASARMKMASAGIERKLPQGMESLSDTSGLSTSQFMESNRYNHAVEGELSRTIMTLDGVTKARVHLAIPDRTLFVGREEKTPTASVALTLSRKINDEQVEAIINLLSGSITGLTPDSVSVVDHHGSLLSDNLLSKTPAKMSIDQMDYVSTLENQITQRAGDMLSPILSPENYRIRVAADVDFSQIERTEESVQGNPVLIKESGMNDRMSEPAAGGIPGSLSNQVPQADDEAEELGLADPTQTGREEYSRHYKTGRTVTHEKRDQSRLERLSVSVLINENAAPESGWTDDQLAEMEDMIRRASGFDEQRGDKISLSLAPFSEQPEPKRSEPSFMDHLYAAAPLIKMGFLGLTTLFLIFFVLRPLVSKLTGTKKKQVDPRDSSDKDNNDSDNAPPLSTSESSGFSGSPDRDYELPSADSDLDIQVNHLRMLVEKEPGRVSDIIKTWVRAND